MGGDSEMNIYPSQVPPPIPAGAKIKCKCCGHMHGEHFPCHEFQLAGDLIPKLLTVNKLHSIGADGKPMPIDKPVTLRERAAIAAMQALLSDFPVREVRYTAEWAVKAADALIAELQKEAQG
jgi:hypothetical protein